MKKLIALIVAAFLTTGAFALSTVFPLSKGEQFSQWAFSTPRQAQAITGLYGWSTNTADTGTVAVVSRKTWTWNHTSNAVVTTTRDYVTWPTSNGVFRGENTWAYTNAVDTNGVTNAVYYAVTNWVTNIVYYAVTNTTTNTTTNVVNYTTSSVGQVTNAVIRLALSQAVGFGSYGTVATNVLMSADDILYVSGTLFDHGGSISAIFED